MSAVETRNKWWKHIKLQVIFFLVSGMLYAQNPVMIHYDTKNGLPGNEVHDICIGPNGYVWIATSEGVSRFDGKEFRNYSLADGLAEMTTFEIFRDHQDRLWFISYSGALSVLNEDSLASYQFNEIILRSKKDNSSAHTDFYVDKNNTVHIAFRNVGALSIDNSGKLVNMEYTFPSNDSRQFLIQKFDDSTYFVSGNDDGSGTSDDNSYYLISGKQMKRRVFEERTTESSTDFIDAVNVGGRNFLLSNNNLYEFKDTIQKLAQTHHGILTVDLIDDELWVGCLSEGIYVFKCNTDGSLSLKERLLEGLSITKITQDWEKGIWISTIEEGLYYMPNKHIRLIDKSSGLKEMLVTAVEFNRDTLYIGDNAGNLYRYSRNNLQQLDINNLNRVMFQNVRGISEAAIHQIMADGNRVYFIKNYRVGVLDKSNGYLKDSLGNAHLVASMSNMNNSLLFANHGIYALRNSQLFPLKEEHRPIRILSFLEIRPSVFIVGCIDGLYQYDARLTPLRDTKPFLGSRINVIMALNNSKVLLGTKGNGIVLYDHEQNRTTRLCKPAIPCGIIVNQIRKVDQLNFWVASNKGLYKLKFKDLTYNEFELFHFTKSFGLGSNSILDLAIGSDKLCLATDQGVTIIPHGVLEGQLVEPKIFLTDVRIDGKKHKIGTQIVLDYDVNQMQLMIGSVGFHTGSRVVYRYRLQGLESKWQRSNNKSVSYGRLPPGSYKFQIQPLDQTGMPSGDFKEVSVLVNTPFWRRWWALPVLISLLFGLVIMIIVIKNRNSRNKLRAQSRIEREMAALELKALRAQMNPHFIFNTLNSIQYLVNANRRETAEEYLEQFAKLLRSVLQKSPKELVTLNEELEIIRSYVKIENLRFDDKIDFTINIDPQIDLRNSFVPGLLIQPFVENAIVHGLLKKKDNAKLNVTLSKEESNLICVIEDNGIGRFQGANITNDDHESIGMSNAEQRLKLINSQHDSVTMEVEDKVDDNGNSTGTKVLLRINILDANELKNNHNR